MQFLAHFHSYECADIQQARSAVKHTLLSHVLSHLFLGVVHRALLFCEL
jgi:hypothetical protein